jgi:hypothetical protein
MYLSKVSVELRGAACALICLGCGGSEDTGIREKELYGCWLFGRFLFTLESVKSVF